MGEFFFTGDEKVTRGQLENFILAKDFPLIPAGMIPGCYPSDNDGGNPSERIYPEFLLLVCVTA